MIPDERRAKIAEHLTRRGYATVAELCDMFSVSEMTIRRDLSHMEKQGMLQRTYGGAAATKEAFYELSFQAQTVQFPEEKGRIARAAADMIGDDEVILIDSGSTTSMLAEHVRHKRITVITNALNIASQLWNQPGIKLLVAGGLSKRSSQCLVGPQTETFFRDVRGDKLFLGTKGVDPAAGVTIPDVIEAHTKRAMVNSANQVIVLADHSKLGRDALSSIIPLAEADYVITGKEGDAEIIERLREVVNVILV